MAFANHRILAASLALVTASGASARARALAPAK
jgi:hypothetical protein